MCQGKEFLNKTNWRKIESQTEIGWVDQWNRKQGVWVKLDEYGMIQSETEFFNGQLDGMIKLYKAGVLFQEEEYCCNHQKRVKDLQNNSEGRTIFGKKEGMWYNLSKNLIQYNEWKDDERISSWSAKSKKFSNGNS